jgi:hypothetical protein
MVANAGLELLEATRVHGNEGAINYAGPSCCLLRVIDLE